MDFKVWLERLYTEIPSVDSSEPNIPVYVNPTVDELQRVLGGKYGEARGIVDGQDVIIWKSGLAFHHHVAKQLNNQGLTTQIDIPFVVIRHVGHDDHAYFFMYAFGSTGKITNSKQAMDTIHNHPNVIRMVGGNKESIYTDNDY